MKLSKRVNIKQVKSCSLEETSYESYEEADKGKKQGAVACLSKVLQQPLLYVTMMSSNSSEGNDGVHAVAHCLDPSSNSSEGNDGVTAVARCLYPSSNSSEGNDGVHAVACCHYTGQT